MVFASRSLETEPFFPRALRVESGALPPAKRRDAVSWRVNVAIEPPARWILRHELVEGGFDDREG